MEYKIVVFTMNLPLNKIIAFYKKRAELAHEVE